MSEFQSQSHRPAQEYWIPVQHRRLPREKFCEYPLPRRSKDLSLQKRVGLGVFVYYTAQQWVSSTGAELDSGFTPDCDVFKQTCAAHTKSSPAGPGRNFDERGWQLVSVPLLLCGVKRKSAKSCQNHRMPWISRQRSSPNCKVRFAHYSRYWAGHEQLSLHRLIDTNRAPVPGGTTKWSRRFVQLYKLPDLAWLIQRRVVRRL